MEYVKVEKLKKWAYRISKEIFVEEQTILSFYQNYRSEGLPDQLARTYTEGDIFLLVYTPYSQFEIGGEG